MSEALVIALSFVLNAALPYVIVKRDLARLPEEKLCRAWNEASFLSAVVAFGPLSIPVHFVKTRRSLAGLGLGLGYAAGAVLCSALAEAGLAWALGVP
ncbi:MAG TPA: hypothetical protein VHV51_23265 [Polyangiaceae bacterium]|jgi:hypothetical protein|nr:hypothetical protein [Polyangiaceae bacterium]